MSKVGTDGPESNATHWLRLPKRPADPLAQRAATEGGVASTLSGAEGEIATLYKLIAHLSADLTDEGAGYSNEGLHNMRRRVANALPDDMLPDWLRTYRDPPLVSAALGAP